jgi:hypothetical protein
MIKITILVLTLLIGVVTILKKVFDKKEQRKIENEKKFQEANSKSDVGGMICLIFCLIFFAGCQTTTTVSKVDTATTLLETEFFPVAVEVNGVSFDTMSVVDLIKLDDWSEIKITPVRKNQTGSKATHYLITPRAIDKLRPKAE